jgi:hypothetical protein
MIRLPLFSNCKLILSKTIESNQVNMGILQDVFNALKEFELTKIDGQPTDEDINKLTTQLSAALVTISTGNGGGKLGHIGIVVPESRYVTLSVGHKIVRPTYLADYVVLCRVVSCPDLQTRVSCRRHVGNMSTHVVCHVADTADFHVG